jgi:HK97 family phage major capsid protein/HK97 family phage prohead protease
MKRAYSLLTIKSIDDDSRVLEGIATTPSPDRMGDVVEPKGAVFKLPIPLLWQHDAEQPIGHVISAKVGDDGIAIRARIQRIDEPGRLKDRLDEAWQSIKHGLVRGLSIGFSPLESESLGKDTWAQRFLSWDWLELSAVTIPANAEASITALKSADRALRAASGARSVVHLNSPGDSGNPHTPKGPDMKTIQEQIGALEAKRAATAARMNEIQNKAIGEGRTKNEVERTEFDDAVAEIKTIDSELVDLREMEKLAITKAAVIDADVGTNPDLASRARGSSVEVNGRVATVSANVEKGIRFARSAMALYAAKGDRTVAAEIAKQRWGAQTPEVERYLKAAVAAGDTTTSGWASELAYARDMEGEFVEYLRPMTILGKLNGVRRVPFNIRYGTQTATSTGNWVGQGAPVPVSKPTVSSGSLGIAKASAIVAIDEELARLSTPSAEAFVRDDMAKTLATFLDVQFVDPNVAASANVSPASITNGVTLTAATGTAAANLRTDVATLLTNLSRNEIDLSGVVFIMAPETALNISLLLTSLGTPIYPDITPMGGTLLGMPVITSNSANIPGSPASGRMIIAVSAPDILLADDGGVSIDVSRDTALQLLDNPTNASTGSTVATTMVSMFQTHSLALRATRFINWAKRRTTAVEYIKEAAYVA